MRFYNVLILALSLTFFSCSKEEIQSPTSNDHLVKKDQASADCLFGSCTASCSGCECTAGCEFGFADCDCAQAEDLSQNSAQDGNLDDFNNWINSNISASISTDLSNIDNAIDDNDDEAYGDALDSYVEKMSELSQNDKEAINQFAEDQGWSPFFE